MGRIAEDDDISTGTRAEWAQRALEAYRQAKGEDLDDVKDELADLIADLLLLGKREGITSADDLLSTAKMHFDEEEVGWR